MAKNKSRATLLCFFPQIVRYIPSHNKYLLACRCFIVLSLNINADSLIVCTVQKVHIIFITRFIMTIPGSYITYSVYFIYYTGAGISLYRTTLLWFTNHLCCLTSITTSDGCHSLGWYSGLEQKIVLFLNHARIILLRGSGFVNFSNKGTFKASNIIEIIVCNKANNWQ